MADEFAQDLLRLMRVVGDVAVSDRVTAIVCAAYIERHVTALIRRKMPGLTPSLTKAIFDETSGPLATIGSKINVGIALHAFPDRLGPSMKLIARVRNQFAHWIEVESFEHPKVSSLVDNMSIEGDKSAEFYNPEGGAINPNGSRRDRFTHISMVICSTIAHANVDKYPYVFSDPSRDKRPTSRAILLSPSPKGPKDHDPEDQ